MTNPNKNLWEGIKNFVYKKYGQESGKMLVHVGLITWTTACISQVVAVALNKQIPSDQKKFLIPQEIADGALNVLAFYLITNSLKNIGAKLVTTGKWTTKGIKEYVEKKGLPENLKLGDEKVNLNKLAVEDQEFQKLYGTFKTGIDMMSTVTGAVISSNLITPYIRNIWGAHRQKEEIVREKAIQKKPTTQLNPYSNRTSLKV